MSRKPLQTHGVMADRSATFDWRPALQDQAFCAKITNDRLKHKFHMTVWDIPPDPAACGLES